MTRPACQATVLPHAPRTCSRSTARGTRRGWRSAASPSTSRPGGSPRSWARRDRGSPRCSTGWPASAGRDALTSGHVYIGDVDLTTLSEKQLTLIRREKVGFVFQAYNLVPTLTAAENITLPLDIAGDKPDRGWFDTVVDAVGLRSRLGHRPNELSGGQQQRVAGARALVSKPEIVYADEPTGNLDSKSGAELLSFLRSAVDDHQQTIVMVTHDPSAASFADRVVFLSDGHVVDEMRDPTSERVLDRLKSLEVC